MSSPRRSRYTGALRGSFRRSSQEALTTDVDDDDDVYVRRAGQPSPTPRRRTRRRRSSRSPSPTHTTAPPRKRFGLTVPTDERKYIGKFDFEEKYPEDPIYEELGPNARVWRANMDECEVYDNDMVTEARDGLDLLLVFAGLFSAVLTTFVAQTSQALSNNFPAVSTSLLLEMVTLQRAFINGTSIDNVSSTEMTSGPSGFDVWVNALWFTSLTLSLGTALMAVLVKQWLHQYMSTTSGTSRDRSLIRHYRFEGLRKWRVLTIIGTLPIILHVALGVFLAGLVVLLIPLNIPLACVIGFITLVIYVVYAVSNILPILYAQCPYRTPFSDTLNFLMRPVLCFVPLARASRIVNRPIQLFLFSMAAASSSESLRPISIFLRSAVVSAMAHIRKTFSASTTETPSPPQNVFRTLKEAERIAATADDVAEQVACDALMWLYQVTSNPPTKSVILQSVGCFADNVSGSLAAVVNTDLEDAVKKTIQEMMNPLSHWAVRPGQETYAERLLRSNRHLDESQVVDRHQWVLDKEAVKPPFPLLISILLHKPNAPSVVDLRGKGMYEWAPETLMGKILEQYEANNPILLPSVVWQRLFNSVHESPLVAGTMDIISLCSLALQNFLDGVHAVMPFADGVAITHRSVPLFKFVTTLLSRQSDVDSEPLWGLLVMSESIVARLLPDWDNIAARAIPALDKVWQQIGKLSGLSARDILALCCSAENFLLQKSSFDSRLHKQDDVKHMRPKHWRDDIYITILEVAYRKTNNCITTPSTEAFKKLFWDMYQSGCKSDSGISRALCLVFDDSVHVPCYYNLFCESPLFSTQTVKSLYHIRKYLLPLVVAFVTGLTRGTLPPDVPLRCMVYLCAEPDRLFTVCRILAMSDPHRDSPGSKQTLLVFARLIPSHVVWKSRARYMLAEPQDWPYIRPLDTEYEGKYQADTHENEVIQLKDMMRDGLRVLDEFFTSFNNPPLPVPYYLPGNSGAYIPFLQAISPTTSAFQPSSSACEWLVDTVIMEPNNYPPRPIHHIYSDEVHTQSIVIPTPRVWMTWLPDRLVAPTPLQQHYHIPLVDDSEVLELEDGSYLHSHGHRTSDTPTPIVAQILDGNPSAAYAATVMPLVEDAEGVFEWVGTSHVVF